MPAARGAVVSLLSDPDWQVREAAAEAIGKFTDAPANFEVLPALLRLLDDDYWQVRVRAVRSLGRLKARQAVSAIGAALTGDIGNLRKEAAAALGEIADPASLPLLQAHANDPDPDVRRNVR
jgi:HEAT repeat protein